MARRQFWIAPQFQGRMVRQWIALALASTVITQIITACLIWYQSSRSPGQYFYVSAQSQDLPVIVDPVTVSVYRIILPSVVAALVMGLLASILAGIYYSHRLAGPIYRIRRTLHEAQEGQGFQPILLRKNDEFQDLADDINQLLDSERGLSWRKS